MQFLRVTTTERVHDDSTLEARKAKSKKMRETHTEFIPVYATLLGDTSRIYRFLINKSNRLTALQVTFRKKVNVSPAEGLFVMIEKLDKTGKVSTVMGNSNDFIGNVHERYGHPDGFLYLHFAKENVFG